MINAFEEIRKRSEKEKTVFGNIKLLNFEKYKKKVIEACDLEKCPNLNVDFNEKDFIRATWDRRPLPRHELEKRPQLYADFYKKDFKMATRRTWDGLPLDYTILWDTFIDTIPFWRTKSQQTERIVYECWRLCKIDRDRDVLIEQECYYVF